MPLSSEVVKNKPLSGLELAEVLVKGLRGLLSKDGMFAEHIGYGRVTATIRVKLEMDNLSYPTHELYRDLGPSEGLEAFPLKGPSRGATALDLERKLEIVSPNATRILNDMPITIQVAQGGQIVTKELNYDKEGLPPQPEPQDTFRSEAAYEELKGRWETEGGKGE